MASSVESHQQESLIARVLAPGPRGRLLSLTILGVVSVLAASRLPELRVDRGDERLIAADDPGWPALRRMQQTFGDESSVLIYLRADPLWTAERLRTLQAFTSALADMPGITRVRSVLDATNIRDKGRYVDAGPLVDVVPDDPARLASLRDDALYGPLIRGHFVSADGNATAVFVSYRADPADPDYELRLNALLDARLASLRPSFEQVFHVGWPRLNAEIDRGLKRDLGVVATLAVAVLLVTVMLGLRTVRALPVPLVSTGLTILWTFGFMAAVGIPVTLLTAMLPALIVVVGAVEDVHLMANYLDGLHGAAPPVRSSAVRYMARHVGSAIVVTSFTTLIGFLSNGMAEIPLIREFSLAAAFAMFANFVVTITVVPLWLQWAGPTRSALRRLDTLPRGPVGGVVELVERLSTGRSAVVVVLVVFTIVAVLLSRLPGLTVNNDPLAYFADAHPFVGDARCVQRDLAGLQHFGVMLTATQPGWFKTVDGVAALAAAQAEIEAQRVFDSTRSLADLMALMQREMHAGDPAWYRVPSTQADLDLYLGDMPRRELDALVDTTFTTALISVRHGLADSMRLNAVVDMLENSLPRVLEGRARVDLVGSNLMINRAAESLIKSELWSLAVVLGVIFGLFSVLYTSWHAGLLALIPNVIPIIVNFGIMSVLRIPLNPGTAMVAAIAIGLAVDDTIHLMTRYGAESRIRVDERAAVRATVRAEAVPVLTSACALGLGFTVFGLSDFRIVAEFGLLAAATMAYAALSDLLLMPILLRHLRLATVWDIVTLDLDPMVLARCPLFDGMTSYQVKKLVLLSDVVRFGGGESLIRQGDEADGMFVLLNGTASIVLDRDGAAVVIDRARPGDIVGEIGFAGSGVRRTASVVADVPVTAVVLDARRMHRGLRFYPALARQVYRNITTLLGQRLQQSHQRLLASTRSRAQPASRLRPARPPRRYTRPTRRR